MPSGLVDIDQDVEDTLDLAAKGHVNGQFHLNLSFASAKGTVLFLLSAATVPVDPLNTPEMFGTECVGSCSHDACVGCS